MWEACLGYLHNPGAVRWAYEPDTPTLVSLLHNDGSAWDVPMGAPTDVREDRAMHRSLMATRLTSLIAAALTAVVMVACGSSGTSHKANPKPATNAAPQFIPADNTLGTPLIGE